jgi:hypothetical protein
MGEGGSDFRLAPRQLVQRRVHLFDRYSQALPFA